MRKTKVLLNSNKSLVVSHPDWTEEQLTEKMFDTFTDASSCLVVSDNVDEFPDLEFGEDGKRQASFLDLF